MSAHDIADMSAYEAQRLITIQENNSKLRALGLLDSNEAHADCALLGLAAVPRRNKKHKFKQILGLHSMSFTGPCSTGKIVREL